VIGTRLGRYRVVDTVAEGGMGVVYRAPGNRLDRDVELEVLWTEVAEDPDRLARFEREATALVAQSKPKILAIHDSAIEGGVPWAALELLKGGTLRECPERERLSWRPGGGERVSSSD
jgi:serine/threonine protein kinase